jgi:antitoxin (DNA-binding transcriptional repressor) of toxin-antitoxin stability system
MASVAPRDLRNHYGELLARAEAGESVDVVRDGRIVATLGPPRRPAGTPRGRLVDVFRGSESVDVERFFDDLYGREGLDDELTDPMADLGDGR